MGSGTSKVTSRTAKTEAASKSAEKSTLQESEDQEVFPPNFAEFPSFMTLRAENLRYSKWKKEHSKAKPLYTDWVEPAVIRKRDAFQLHDFRGVDTYALQTPWNYVDKPLEELVHYLVAPYQDDLQKARVLFRWFCAQDLNQFNSYAPGSVGLLLCELSENMVSYPFIYQQMCRLSGLQCEVIEGVIKCEAGDTMHDFSPTQEWNAVNINNVWHLVDVNFAHRTVGSNTGEWELIDDNGQGYKKEEEEQQGYAYGIDEFYFLTDPEEFIYTHYPTWEGWQLLARPVTKDEFQAMAYLRCPFFELGMDCLQEKKLTLHSQCKETQIKLGLPHSGNINFLYRLWKSSTDGSLDFNQTENAQLVYMERNEDILRIKVMYQVKGKYKLSLYMRGEDDTADTWDLGVEYLLICEDSKKGHSLLPSNERYEWGPGLDIEKLGMTPVTHKRGTIETDDGEAEVVFTLNSLIDVSTKIRNNKEESLDHSTLCAIEDGKVTVRTRVLEKGTYALDIYAKAKDDEGTQPLVCTYLLNVSSGVADNYLFPSIGNQHAGKLDSDTNFQIVAVSHQEAYFTSAEGFETIVFNYSLELNFLAEVMLVHADGTQKIENHTSIEQTKNTVTFKVRFPRDGMYDLSIFAKKRDDPGTYSAVYRYVIHVPLRMKDCSPFPVQYLKLGCAVHGMENGYLMENDDISVEIQAPNAVSAAVIKIEGKSTNFSRGANGCWNVTFNSGKAGKDVQLSAQFDKSKKSFDPLFQYEVKTRKELDEIQALQEKEFQEEQDRQEEIKVEKKRKKDEFDKLQKELVAAIESEDVQKLEQLVAEVENSFLTNRLREEYVKGKELIRSNEKIVKLKKSILQMKKSTMAEIRSYAHPPEGVHQTMMAALLLLQKHEGKTNVWQKCQGLCNTSVLSKAVERFKVKELQPEIAARALALLQAYRLDDLVVKSAGAATFYTWVVGMTEELNQMTDGGVKKAVPALIKRQKEIFKSEICETN